MYSVGKYTFECCSSGLVTSRFLVVPTQLTVPADYFWNGAKLVTLYVILKAVSYDTHMFPLTSLKYFQRREHKY